MQAHLDLLAALKEVPDDVLHSRLQKIAGEARRIQVLQIIYLMEIDRRELHLLMGYSSIYDYGRRALRLSEDQAYRFMTAARLAGVFPEILTWLERGEVHLSGLTLLKKHLRTPDDEWLLELSRGKSKRAIERLLAEIFPKDTERPERIEFLSDLKARLEVVLDIATIEKLQYAAEMMSHLHPQQRLDKVIDLAANLVVEFLEKKRQGKTARPRTPTPPTPRTATPPTAPTATAPTLPTASAPTAPTATAPTLPTASAPTAPTATAPSAPTLPTAPTAPTAPTLPTAPTSNHSDPHPSARDRVTTATRRAVFERDGWRCTYVGPDGVHCTSRAQIEIDHRTPRAHGGSSEKENLGNVCRAHNQHLARQILGTDRVEHAIQLDRSRRERAKAKATTVAANSIQCTRVPAVPPAPSPKHPDHDLLIRALKGMGFNTNDATRALQKVAPLEPVEGPPLPVGLLLRDVLRSLGA